MSHSGRGVDNGGGDIQGISVPSSKICCESKTAL